MTASTASKRVKAPLLATLIFLVIGALGAGYWWMEGQYHVSTDNAYLKGDIVTISPKVSGYIVARYVDDNQFVKAGTLLAEIDDRDYRAAVSQAKAALASASANVEHLHAQQTLQHSKIRQAASQMASAQAEYDRAKQQVARTQRLIAQHYSSEDELDAQLAQQKVRLAQLEQAKAAHHAASDQLAVLASELKQAQAAIDDATAKLTQAQLNLDDTRLYAPVDGVIGKRSLRVGMLVQPGMPLVSLVPQGEVWVEANFKETQLAHIQPGQSVDIEVDAFPGQALHGVVDSFSPATGAQFALLPPENATGNFTKIVQRVPIKVRIPDQPLKAKLLPGLSVIATVDTRG
ncbi:hemolysin D [Salinivibrio sp. IB574]|uniref:HlyD family secretion protein n=1 Tax=Salinivibrio sp. IB574 TaxID=1909444 RepID=UPI000988C197|nr:HlyD family secretion protein [Salinivibrio sp. IB574]OOF21652.1 hemolysin D [Salinivibrio sp. IB574]